MQKIDHIVNLLKDYLTGDIGTQRTDEVERIFIEHPHLREIVEELEREEGLRNALKDYEELYNEAFQARQEQVLNRVLSRVRRDHTRSRIGGMQRRIAIYTSIAAAAIMVFFVTVLLIQKDEVSLPAEEVVGNFMPGRNKASLTLSNGQQIDLSDMHAGIIVDDQIGYEDGALLFDGDSVEEHAMLTLSTPRGGQYQVTLSDGTKVWLNAESKLHYPYHFSEEIRHVELEGEAYFEVAHRENKPFIVATASEKVEVLGTHFNIHSYQTDIRSTVALIEGKIKVSSGDDIGTVLKPGQQTVVVHGRMEVQSVDVDESIAWKNGEFMFNNETLASVMKKLARWYDLDIEVSPEVQDVEIWGSVSRYDNFNTVLKLIKMTDDNIHFAVEGRRVKVMK